MALDSGSGTCDAERNTRQPDLDNLYSNSSSLFGFSNQWNDPAALPHASRSGKVELPNCFITFEKPDQPLAPAPEAPHPRPWWRSGDEGVKFDDILATLSKRSEIPYLRQKLNEAGIDVNRQSKIKVAVLEPADTKHSARVAGVISDPELGVFPGAIVHRAHLNDKSTSMPEVVPTDPPELRKLYGKLISEAINSVSDHLRQFKGTDYRVINLSYNVDRTTLYTRGLAALFAAPAENMPLAEEMLGKEKAAEWLKYMKSPDRAEMPIPHEKELVEGIIKFLDGIIDGDERVKQASANFKKTTSELAGEGKVIVVAMGNWGKTLAGTQAKIPDGARMNLFAQDENVISVANADINGTPGNRQDDLIHETSSPGSAKYPPTISAQGTRVPIRDKNEGFSSGTSMAAPMVAGTVALMLDQNPDLKPSQVKSILESTATKIQGTKEQQGAGMINADKAVIEARRLAAKKAEK